MADIPIAGKGSESPSSGSPTGSLRRSRSMVSLRPTGASILQVFPDGSTTTLSRRSGSPLESPRSPKSQRTSFNGREDLDDPIELFSSIPCTADCSQETIVPPSIPGESTLDPGDTHHPGDSTPKALTTSLPPSLPPSRPLTPPSASAEAAAAAFVTPPVSQYTSTVQRTPSVTNSPAVNQMALDGPKGDTNPQADVREPAILVPGTPPSQPPSRNVSQIPTLPVNLLDVPLSFGGKDSAAANIILATIIKAGGKAQTSMTEGPSTNHGLRIIGQLVAETAQGLEALADAAIAHTDRDVYRQLTEVRSEFRNMIYHVLRDLDRITERDAEAGFPAEAIPTDSFAMIRAISDLQESFHIEMDMFKGEIRTELATLKAARQAAAQTPAGQTPKATSSRNPAPKPQPPPKPTVQPAAPKPAQAPNPTSKGIPAPPAPTQPLPSFNWDDEVQREQDGDTPMGPPPIVDLADFIDIPPATDLAPEAGDDGFTRVEKGKGKAHGSKPKPSFAQAAKAAASRPAPGPPAFDAAKIANHLRAMGRTQTPTRYVASSKSFNADFTRKTARTMYTLANQVFIHRSSNTRVIHIDWNRKNRLVLQFPHATSLGEIEAAIPDLVKALELPKDTTFERCSRWSKVAVSRVPTGIETGTRYSSDKLLETLHINHHVTTLEVVQAPRWIAKDPNPEKDRSTFTFCFEDDADSTLLDVFIKQPLFMWGERVRVTKWNDKPVLKGCTKCMELDHFAGTCRNQPRCGKCAGRHLTGEHHCSCTQCKKEKRAMSLDCVHPLKCSNCGGPHGAENHACPKRSAYRVPVARSLQKAEAPRAETPVDLDDE